MPSEEEMVRHFHNAVLVRVALQYLVEILSLSLGTFDLYALVRADLQSNKLAALLHILTE